MTSAPPTLRSRTNVHSSTQNDSSSPPSRVSTPDADAAAAADPTPTHLTPLDILRTLCALLLLSTTLSYFTTRTSLTWNLPLPRPSRIKAYLQGPLNLTAAELSAYDGTDPTLPILLGLNGSIYDVSASRHLYGPGGSYAFFAGRDATRAFVTGCFGREDLNGDLRGVEEMFMVGEGRGERERRVARRRVEEVVRGWERWFDGGWGGRYFWVGRVWMGEGGWGEVRELCRKAREGRPRREAEGVR